MNDYLCRHFQKSEKCVKLYTKVVALLQENLLFSKSADTFTISADTFTKSACTFTIGRSLFI